MIGLTQSRLKTLLDYDPETGTFAWRVRRGGPAMEGSVAGTIGNKGYLRIAVDGRRYMAHRLAWLYVHGAFPVAGMDHVNGVRDDNRIVNLREATHAENAQNRAKDSNNSSGYLGVCWNFQTHNWKAYIGVDGKIKHLGLFDAPDDAHAAYVAAKAKFHTFNPAVRGAVRL